MEEQLIDHHSKAPWSKTQTGNLNRWQKSGLVHPFTCGTCRDANPWPEPTEEHANAEGPFEDHEYRLRATQNGWVCDNCGYTQDWAWDIMLQFSAAVAKAGNPFGGPVEDVPQAE